MLMNVCFVLIHSLALSPSKTHEEPNSVETFLNDYKSEQS